MHPPALLRCVRHATWKSRSLNAQCLDAVHPCKEMEQQQLFMRRQSPPPPCQPTTHYPHTHHACAPRTSTAQHRSPRLTRKTAHGTQALVQALCDQAGTMPSCTTPSSLCPVPFLSSLPLCPAACPLPLPSSLLLLYSYLQSPDCSVRSCVSARAPSRVITFVPWTTARTGCHATNELSHCRSPCLCRTREPLGSLPGK